MVMALNSAEGTDKEELIMRSGRKGVQQISGEPARHVSVSPGARRAGTDAGPPDGGERSRFITKCYTIRERRPKQPSLGEPDPALAWSHFVQWQ